MGAGPRPPPAQPGGGEGGLAGTGGRPALHLRDLGEARALYDEAWAAAPPRASAVLKLSDVAFLLHDLESERRYRERYYGTLEER